MLQYYYNFDCTVSEYDLKKVRASIPVDNLGWGSVKLNRDKVLIGSSNKDFNFTSALSI